MRTPRDPPGWGPSVPGPPVAVKEKVGEEADVKEEKEGTNEEGEGDEKEVEAEEPVEPAEPEPLRPLGSNPSSVRTKRTPFHCPACKIWLPSVSVLRFYHSETSEHKFAVDSLLKERDAKKLAGDTE